MLSQLIRSAPERVQVIEVFGRIDAQGDPVLQRAIESALAGGRTRLLLDLHGVEYINSAGLRTLVSVYKRVRQQGGALVLINPTENVQRLLDLVGLDSVLEVFYDARWDSTLASTKELPPAHRQVCYCL